MNNISFLLKKFNIQVKDKNLYEVAFTHPSYNNLNSNSSNYQKLEFIGDAILDYVSADLIFKLRPELNEGNMTKLRIYLVRSESLADFSLNLGLYRYVKVGNSFPANEIIHNQKILEDIFESFVGAIYLDNDMTTIYNFLSAMFKKTIISIDVKELTDPKSMLQELMQAENRNSVYYELVNTEGPAHNRRFTVNVLYNGIVLGTGTGKTKKSAEEQAANNALKKRST